MSSPLGPWWDHGVPIGGLVIAAIFYVWSRYDAYRFDQKWGRDPGE